MLLSFLFIRGKIAVEETLIWRRKRQNKPSKNQAAIKENKEDHIKRK